MKFWTRIKKTLISWLFGKKASFSLALIFSFFILPAIFQTNIANSDQEEIYSPESSRYNSQTVTLLNSKARPDPDGPVGGEDDLVIADEALVPNISPITDVEAERVISASPDDISIYTVRDGDTLGQIADMFDISPNTIRWANDIDVKGTIKPGQELIIFPIDGIKHKVQKGETIASIAKKYKGDAREISLFNGIEEDESLALGTEIIIPNGEISDSNTSSSSKGGGKTTSKETPSGYYIKPVKGIKTQGNHDRYHAMDIGAPTGTPIWAMADGRVIVAKSPLGYNGGYGGMVVIQHNNGTQTLYAHMSKLEVSAGQTVKQGTEIGKVGETGHATGPHLHVEIRTGKTGISGIGILEKMY